MRQKISTTFKQNEGVRIPSTAVLNKLKLHINDYYKEKVGFNKGEVLDAIDARDREALRLISKRAAAISSGIYSRLLWYMALLPTYDCIIDPYLKNNEKMIDHKDEIDKVMKKALAFTDNLRIHHMASYLAYDVLMNGVSYKLKIDNGASIVLQDLPIKFCRTRYQINNKDIIEFNVKYFDTIRDEAERKIILNSLPPIFSKEYNRYRNNKLPLDKDRGAWFAIPSELGEVFYLTKDFFPYFVKIIPDILDWEAIKDLNLLKSEQELSKILVQRFAVDKNGELSLNMAEIQQIHQNALDMVGEIEGLDVLTTFADVSVLDLQQKSGFNQSNDPLKNFLNSIYTNAGVSANLFATDGNLALDKSITNDESVMFMLFVEKIQNFINYELNRRFGTNKVGLICNFPRITIYNFKEMADMFKGQAMYGYSKRLPAIATGQSQSSLMAGIEYENEVMNMAEAMRPLQSSATQSNKPVSNSEEKETGRPTLPDSQKSDKTIKNLESSK